MGRTNKGGYADKSGRWVVSVDGRRSYTYQLVAEAALGKQLPKGAVVHHIDNNKFNNEPTNLLICQDHTYHMLIHQRQRVVEAGGDPNTQKICGWCKLVKNFDQFYVQHAGRKNGKPTAKCKSCIAYLEMFRPRRYILKERIKNVMH